MVWNCLSIPIPTLNAEIQVKNVSKRGAREQVSKHFKPRMLAVIWSLEQFYYFSLLSYDRIACWIVYIDNVICLICRCIGECRPEGCSWNICPRVPVNTLRPRQNDRHFAEDIFEWIFCNENVWILIKISWKIVPRGPTNNIPALV